MTRLLILTATFISAVLLFVVQPLFAKYLLPFFGGTSSVWTISIFFYSTTLLLGYLYAALLMSWPNRIARLVHSLLLILAGALLLARWLTTGSPLLIPATEHALPAVSVLLTLLQGVGLSVLLLASTSVVAQHLYARLVQVEPYALYALSNAGSLIGLAMYPFVVEPFTTLPMQSAWWAVAFVAFLLLVIGGWRQVDRRAALETAGTTPVVGAALRNRGLIVFMAAIPTFLLASGTEFLSKGIASFPLMWVIPLMLYLTSFIVAFGERRSLPNALPLGILALLAILPVFALIPVMNIHAIVYWFTFIVFMGAFFLICTYFHRRVYHLRPRISDLGPFYVYLTLGGALGSGIVGLILPFVLNDQIEIYLLLGLLASYFALYYVDVLRPWLPLVLRRGLQVGVIVVAIVFVFKLTFTDGLIASERNFYGTLKVYDTARVVNGSTTSVRMIVNGATNHGMQALDPAYASEAASYYGPDSGIDITLRSFIDQGISPRVSVVGLGAGMMNAYCDRVSEIAYIEVNPAVEKLARDYFSYLEQCTEKTSVTTGDGRLLLEAATETAAPQYEVIMMDAFTDDAIPAHLLTTEAFSEAYKPLLTENGVIAFHVSNRYLDLRPPIAGLAQANGYEAVVVVTHADPTNELYQTTSWVLVTRPENVETLLAYPNVRPYTGPTVVWTDYQHSVMDAISWHGAPLDLD